MQAVDELVFAVQTRQAQQKHKLAEISREDESEELVGARVG